MEVNKLSLETNLYTNLHKYFRHKQFQEGQKEIVEAVLKGDDVLGILRTGSGKSLCYQLPAIMLPGITIVVSPLISLMVDQVRQVKSFYYKEVVALHSVQTRKERQFALNQLQYFKLVYISPELLQQETIIAKLRNFQVSLFVIDEAHCISQWGYDFRPDYLRLSQTIDSVGNPPILALTGTATMEVQLDIKDKLKRPNMHSHVYPMDRPNISLVVEKIDRGEKEKFAVLSTLLNTYRQPTIIYFSSRKMTEQIASLLSDKIPHRNIAYYHGGMENNDRLKIQQQFLNDQLDVICCTSAFGMGINKKNIRFVIHYHLPTQIESFIQEIGRAGRDGEDSVSIVLYRPGDEHIPLQIINNDLPTDAEVLFVANRLHDLYKANKPLPENTEEVNFLFQLDETKWRFLQFQFEINGMLKENEIMYDNRLWKEAIQKIKQFCTNRINEKLKKFEQMSTWIQSSSCLREELYKTFQHTIQKREMNCCSNCGCSLHQYEQSNQVIDEELTYTWQEKLAQLLLVGDTNETS